MLFSTCLAPYLISGVRLRGPFPPGEATPPLPTQSSGSDFRPQLPTPCCPASPGPSTSQFYVGTVVAFNVRFICCCPAYEDDLAEKIMCFLEIFLTLTKSVSSFSSVI